jgi:hypothetical protein
MAPDRAEFPPDAAAANPDHQPSPVFPQDWKSGAVDPLCTQHIDVVELRELFGREGLSWTENHMTGVVNHYVEAARFTDNLTDGLLHGLC